MCARKAVPLVIAVLLCVGVRAGGAAPDCVASWGTGGAAGQGALAPQGLALDGQGNLYVTDLLNHCVVKFRCDGVRLLSWGGPGVAAGEFRGPSAVAVNEAAQVFVADTYNHRIQKFTSAGEPLLTWGARGSGPGDFDQPRGIAVDAAGAVYVADAGNFRIQKFTGMGEFLAEWSTGLEETGGGRGGGHGDEYERPPDGGGEGGPGLLGAGLELLAGPRAVAVGPDGKVTVLQGSRVLQFSERGRLLRAWGAPGSGDGELMTPAGLVVGPGELVFVADEGNGRIQIYTPTGRPVDAWSSTAREGNGGGGRPGDEYERPPDAPGVRLAAGEEAALALPLAVASDARGHLYVVDGARAAVFEFAYASMPQRAICDLDPRALGCGVQVCSGEPLAVAILGEPVFPAGEIDVCTLTLCGGGSPLGCHEEDLCAVVESGDLGSVPGPDGCADLVLRFEACQVLAAAGLEGPGQGEVTLIGARYDGTPFWGSAPVTASRAAGGYVGPRPPEHYRRLQFTVPEASRVVVRVYDVAGRLMRTLDDGFRAAGLHTLDWEANALPAGVYFYRIVSGAQVESRKVVILP